MLRPRLLGVLILAGLVLGAVPRPGAAAAPTEAPKQAGEGGPVTVWDRETKTDYNLPQDGPRLIQDLMKGEEHHLTIERPSSILEEYADLGLWSLVVFLVLLAVLARFAWKPMLAGLHKREEFIRSSLEEAERAREEARKLQAQLQQERSVAEQQLAELLEQGRRDAQRVRDEMLEQTRSEIRAERERLHREIDSARDQALHEIWAKTADLATAISGKVLRRSINPEDQRRLVDEALAEILRNGNGQGRPAV